MRVSKNVIVERLREMGRDEEADRALEELPNRFHLEEYGAHLTGYGLDPESFRHPVAPPPGPFL